MDVSTIDKQDEIGKRARFEIMLARAGSGFDISNAGIRVRAESYAKTH